MSSSTLDLPFSQACENNKAPILGVLRRVFARCGRVLEVGSGTGQHAVYFSEQLSHLKWQSTDLPEHLPALKRRFALAPRANLLAPQALDAAQPAWPRGFDAVFSANTWHIMAWEDVVRMVENCARVLQPGGLMVIYGPFNYRGQYTSDSNREFDAWLKTQAAHQGLRDVAVINHITQTKGFYCLEDHAMPANNRLIVWQKA